MQAYKDINNRFYTHIHNLLVIDGGLLIQHREEKGKKHTLVYEAGKTDTLHYHLTGLAELAVDLKAAADNGFVCAYEQMKEASSLSADNAEDAATLSMPIITAFYNMYQLAARKNSTNVKYEKGDRSRTVKLEKYIDEKIIQPFSSFLRNVFDEAFQTGNYPIALEVLGHFELVRKDSDQSWVLNSRGYSQYKPQTQAMIQSLCESHSGLSSNAFFGTYLHCLMHSDALKLTAVSRETVEARKTLFDLLVFHFKAADPGVSGPVASKADGAAAGEETKPDELSAGAASTPKGKGRSRSRSSSLLGAVSRAASSMSRAAGSARKKVARAATSTTVAQHRKQCLWIQNSYRENILQALVSEWPTGSADAYDFDLPAMDVAAAAVPAGIATGAAVDFSGGASAAAPGAAGIAYPTVPALTPSADSAAIATGVTVGYSVVDSIAAPGAAGGAYPAVPSYMQPSGSVEGVAVESGPDLSSLSHLDQELLREFRALLDVVDAEALYAQDDSGNTIFGLAVDQYLENHARNNELFGVDFFKLAALLHADHRLQSESSEAAPKCLLTTFRTAPEKSSPLYRLATQAPAALHALLTGPGAVETWGEFPYDIKGYQFAIKQFTKDDESIWSALLGQGHAASGTVEEALLIFLMDHGLTAVLQDHDTMPTTAEEAQKELDVLPLYLAAQAGSAALVATLLDRGAPVLSKAQYKSTLSRTPKHVRRQRFPLFVAVSKGYVGVVELIINAADRVNTTGFRPVHGREVSQLDHLLWAQNSAGDNVFHQACKAGQFEVFKKLLQHLLEGSRRYRFGDADSPQEADVLHQYNWSGYTAFHHVLHQQNAIEWLEALWSSGRRYTMNLALSHRAYEPETSPLALLFELAKRTDHADDKLACIDLLCRELPIWLAEASHFRQKKDAAAILSGEKNLLYYLYDLIQHRKGLGQDSRQLYAHLKNLLPLVVDLSKEATEQHPNNLLLSALASDAHCQGWLAALLEGNNTRAFYAAYGFNTLFVTLSDTKRYIDLSAVIEYAQSIQTNNDRWVALEIRNALCSAIKRADLKAVNILKNYPWFSDGQVPTNLLGVAFRAWQERSEHSDVRLEIIKAVYEYVEGSESRLLSDCDEAYQCTPLDYVLKNKLYQHRAAAQLLHILPHPADHAAAYGDRTDVKHTLEFLLYQGDLAGFEYLLATYAQLRDEHQNASDPSWAVQLFYQDFSEQEGHTQNPILRILWSLLAQGGADGLRRGQAWMRVILNHVTVRDLEATYDVDQPLIAMVMEYSKMLGHGSWPVAQGIIAELKVAGAEADGMLHLAIASANFAALNALLDSSQNMVDSMAELDQEGHSVLFRLLDSNTGPDQMRITAGYLTRLQSFFVSSEAFTRWLSELADADAIVDAVLKHHMGSGGLHVYFTQLLRLKVNVPVDHQCNTRLHLALHSVSQERALLIHGADGLQQNSQGKTPLDLAIEQGHAEVAKMLISAWDPTVIGPALMAATFRKAVKKEYQSKGSFPITQYLLACYGDQIDLDQAIDSTWGVAALHLAAARGDQALVIQLLEAGANPACLSGKQVKGTHLPIIEAHRTALQLAARNGHSRLVARLLNRQRYGWMPIFVAHRLVKYFKAPQSPQSKVYSSSARAPGLSPILPTWRDGLKWFAVLLCALPLLWKLQGARWMPAQVQAVMHSSTYAPLLWVGVVFFLVVGACVLKGRLEDWIVAVQANQQLQPQGVAVNLAPKAVPSECVQPLTGATAPPAGPGDMTASAAGVALEKYYGPLPAVKPSGRGGQT